MLNAGLRLEVLQQLLGHLTIDITLRYARISDVTREDAYFKAMADYRKRGPVMNMTESILNYRLFLKRKNFSDLTVKELPPPAETVLQLGGNYLLKRQR